MLRMPGKQNNTYKYFYNGFVYYKDSRSTGTIFRCVNKNSTHCPARVYVESLENIENQDIVVVENHNHIGDLLLLLREQFLAELLTQSKTDLQKSVKQIYDEIKAKPKYTPLLTTVQFYTYEKRMFAARRNVLPPVPTSLKDLHEYLDDYTQMSDIYKGLATGEDGSLGLIFINNEMMKALKECTQLFCDGTFDVIIVFIFITMRETKNIA